MPSKPQCSEPWLRLFEAYGVNARDFAKLVPVTYKTLHSWYTGHPAYSKHIEKVVLLANQEFLDKKR